MKAIGNNIIILPKKVGLSKTENGLLLKEKDKENIRYKEAIVVSVSDDVKGIKEADVIYYDKSAGHGICAPLLLDSPRTLTLTLRSRKSSGRTVCMLTVPDRPCAPKAASGVL